MTNSLLSNSRIIRPSLKIGLCALFLLFVLPFCGAHAEEVTSQQPTEVKTLDVKTDIPDAGETKEAAVPEKEEPTAAVKSTEKHDEVQKTDTSDEPSTQTENPVADTNETDNDNTADKPDTRETEQPADETSAATTEQTPAPVETQAEPPEEKQKSALKRPKSKNSDYVPSGAVARTVLPWMAEIGLNDPDFTGLLYNFWYDSDAESLTRYINELERSSTSPAVRRMMVETLTSVTRSPKFRSANPAMEDINFMKARLSALIRIGAFDEAVLLYQKVLDNASATDKHRSIGEEIATLGVEAMALTGSTDAACLEANLIADSLPNNKWLKDKSLCLLQWKQIKSARTLYNFLKQDTDDFAKPHDKAYSIVFNAIANHAYSDGILSSNLPPLWNSMLISQGVPVTAKTVKDNAKNALLLGLLARHDAIPDTTRSLAAIYSAQKGMMSMDKVRNTYLNTNFDATLIGGTIDADGSNTKRQDILYFAARRAYAPDKKAALQKRGLSLINDKTSIPAYLWSDLDRELSYNAVKLERLATHSRSRLLANGVLSYAGDWVKKINLERDEKKPYSDILNRVLESYFSDKPLEEEELNDWVLHIQETFPDDGNERALKSLIALEYAKQPVPRKIWTLVGGKPEAIKLEIGLIKPDKNARNSYVKYYKGDIYLAGLAHFSHSGIDKISPQELLSFMDLYKKYGLSDKNMKIGLEILSQSVL